LRSKRPFELETAPINQICACDFHKLLHSFAYTLGAAAAGTPGHMRKIFMALPRAHHYILACSAGGWADIGACEKPSSNSLYFDGVFLLFAYLQNVVGRL
jgi:hypothetical protein